MKELLGVVAFILLIWFIDNPQGMKDGIIEIIHGPKAVVEAQQETNRNQSLEIEYMKLLNDNERYNTQKENEFLEYLKGIYGLGNDTY